MAGRYVRYIDTRKAKTRALPQPGQFVSGYRLDYAIDGGRSGLTPAKLGRVLRQADVGETRELFEVFSAIEEDPHVHSVLAKRKRKLLSRPMEITASVENDEQAQAAADLCRRFIMGDQGEDGIANWHAALSTLADAVPRGFSLMQIIWENVPGETRPVALERYPQRDVRLGDPDDPETTSDQVRIVTAGNWRGDPLEPRQWVCHVHKSRNDALAKCSLLRIIAWWYLFKRFGIRDWTIFAERYGMPARVGKYPKHSTDEERDAVAKAVTQIGADLGVVVPEGAEIEFIEAGIKGQIPYPQLVEVCDFQISKAVLGGTLTTEAGDRGARALGEVHERTEADIAEADGLMLGETLKQQLCRPIVELNMPEGTPVPDVSFVSTEQEDLKERAERDKILAVDIKLPMTKAYLYQTYGVTVPEEGDELVNEPAEDAPELDGTEQNPQPPGDQDDQDQEQPPMDEQLNRAAVDMASTILGADIVQAMQDTGTPLSRIIALAEDRAKKKSIPWVTPTR